MKYFLKLFRFGDGGAAGGDGGAAGDGAAQGGMDSGADIPSSIPERGRKLYAEVFGKQKSASAEKNDAAVEVGNENANTHKPTYEEMISSEDYKQAHKEYIEKTISERFKRYKGQEERLKEAQSLLGTIGTKYGLDTEDKDFMKKLTEAVDNDDSYYERYAEDHDMTPAEARHIVSLERKLRATEAAQAAAREEEARQAQFRVVQANAAKTQAMYPGFDLATELQNPNFVRILSASNGDTTAAYVATHHGEIIKGVAQSVAQQAQVASANAIAAGANRPIENGMGGAAAASDVSINFSKMSLSDIKKQADIWRSQQKR